MHSATSTQRSIRIHLTNITGTGASQLLKSLLPALVECNKEGVIKVYLPETGLLSTFSSAAKNVVIKKYRRFLPNAISRFLECTLFSYKFDDLTPLLVLGDIPLRVSARQILFVQNFHLVTPKSFCWNPSDWKYTISRFIFRLNKNRVSFFIVQTDIMKAGLTASYPQIADKIRVIPHPPPRWILDCKARDSNHRAQGRNLRVIYPAAEYPHKNHSLLAGIKVAESEPWPVDEILLTIRQVANPASSIPWINCVGHLSSAEMINAYGAVDALLFLSKKESFGFPLLEAMFLGLPVICPDLPYAKNLCGEQAIYFDPDSVESLRTALVELKRLLSDNWRPDWSNQLKSVPKNWDDVASKFLDITFKPLNID